MINNIECVPPKEEITIKKTDNRSRRQKIQHRRKVMGIPRTTIVC